MLEIIVDVGKLSYKHHIPRQVEKDVVFYEFVLRSYSKSGVMTIARIPFKNGIDKDIRFVVYNDSEYIDKYYLNGVYRVFDLGDARLKFFVNKVYLVDVKEVDPEKYIKNGKFKDPKVSELVRLNNKRVGYKQHRERDVHVVFDEIDLSKIEEGTTNLDCTTIKMRKVQSFTPITTFDVSVKRREKWDVNRSFYQRSHVTQDDSAQKEIYHKILVLLLKRKYKNMYQLLHILHKVFYTDIMYKGDTKYDKPDQGWDDNDDNILLSFGGDCEDLSQFFINVYYSIIGCYKYVVKRDTALWEICRQMEQDYRPMGFICRLDNGGSEPEFHSTVLIVPTDEAWKKGSRAIYFEVTLAEIDAVVTSTVAWAGKYVYFHVLLDRVYYSMFKDFEHNKLADVRITHEAFDNY